MTTFIIVTASQYDKTFVIIIIIIIVVVVVVVMNLAISRRLTVKFLRMCISFRTHHLVIMSQCNEHSCSIHMTYAERERERGEREMERVCVCCLK